MKDIYFLYIKQLHVTPRYFIEVQQQQQKTTKWFMLREQKKEKKL